MISLKWSDIAEFVTEAQPKEGARPNAKFYRSLGRQCLGIISNEAKPFVSSWSNADGGSITLSGNSVELPIDCLTVDKVEWDGVEIYCKSAAALDIISPTWRSATGTAPAYYTKQGSTLMLDVAPSGVTTGKLTIRGTKALPDFSDDPLAPNPLDHIPEGHQYAPAYYILANLPVNQQDPAQVARQQQYMAMWKGELQGLIDHVAVRRGQGFSY